MRSLIVCPAFVVATSVMAPPASASFDAVCRVQATFRIGEDDVRSNTTIQIAAGGRHFTVAGGMPSNSVTTRRGQFVGLGGDPTCITNEALRDGWTITSISNPSWPETTDNWHMMGLSLIDPDTGRQYFRRFGGLMHRFTGEQPSFQTFCCSVDVVEPFLDRRYADCFGDQMFVRFVDPLNRDNPEFINVQMRRSGTDTPIASGFFDPDARFRDWGGSLAGLGVSDARAASITFTAITRDLRRVFGATIAPGCNPNSLF